jgi:hypothetical protein
MAVGELAVRGDGEGGRVGWERRLRRCRDGYALQVRSKPRGADDLAPFLNKLTSCGSKFASLPHPPLDA